MTQKSFATFETPVGTCAITWNARGVIGLALPEDDAAGARTDSLRRHRGALEQTPTPDIAHAIDDVTRLLSGQHVDLSTVVLDLSDLPEFDTRVYDIARTIPPGETLTYGQIATRLGDPGLSRAVGQALGRNPIPVIVPCHRVLAAGGRPGGFSAPGGVATKRRLLEIEGARDLHPILPWG